MNDLATIDIATIDLDILSYNAAAVLDRELQYAGPRGLEFIMRELPERLAYQIAAMLKVPGQVLQNDRVLATYPASFWDYIKRALRLKHRLTEVRLTEHLLYPEVAVPERFAKSVRLYVAPSVQTLLQQAR